MDTVGRIAFIAGLILAAIAGFIVDQPWVGWVLALLGGIVGLLNVTAAERQSFLIAGIALAMTVTAFAETPLVGGTLTRLAESMLPFIGGAVFVVALLSLFRTAHD